jgi:hypothetical protein
MSIVAHNNVAPAIVVEYSSILTLQASVLRGGGTRRQWTAEVPAFAELN